MRGLVVGMMMLVGASAHATSDPLLRWPGPYGGLPPVDQARPQDFAAAYARAVEAGTSELDAIGSNPDAPTFRNTIAPLDRAGRDIRRLDTILQIHATTNASETWRDVQREVGPLRNAFSTRLDVDPLLFARVSKVHAGLPASAPDAEAAQLVTLMRDHMLRAGAGLDETSREKLRAVDARIAALESSFVQNLQREDQAQVLVVTEPSRLAGLSQPDISAAAEAATKRGRPGAHAFPVTRPVVWAVLSQVRDRELRRELWTLWMGRGSSDGQNDNRPVTAAMLAARQERAALLGHKTYGHLVLAPRMVSSPEAALALLERYWTATLAAEEERTAGIALLAKADGIDDVRPWDRLYYLDRFANAQFGFEPASLKAWFSLESIRDAMFAAAADTYGFAFERLPGVATVDPGVEVWLARERGRPAGVVYLDLRPRPEKQIGSWALELRGAADGEPGDLPIMGMYTSPPPAADGQPMLLPYDYANVIFHEFGHVLHMLANGARYRGTGSLAVPWDFVEVPALLNERWLLTERTLDRLRHNLTGEPMPADLRQKLRAWRKAERVFSVNPEYLATALVDQHLHLAAARGPVDVVAVERETLARYGLPGSIDPTMRATHAFHTFSRGYGAGVHTYLWSDSLAADLATPFETAPGGFHDADVGSRYKATILSRGAIVPPAEAVGEFLGRPVDDRALLRRFGLVADAP